MTEAQVPVVIDNGSDTVKSGFAGDEKPRNEIPTVVGYPKTEQIAIPNLKKENFFGEETFKYRGILRNKRPIEFQLITNWDDIEKLWHHIFNEELNISTEDHPVIMTETTMNPKCNREKMVEIMFESFRVPAFYTVNCAASALRASGRTTGVALDFGCGGMHVVPIVDGYTVRSAVMKPGVHEMDLRGHLLQMLFEQGINDRDLLREIKDKHCYVALDYEKEQEKFKLDPSLVEKKIEHIDGSYITLNKELYTVPEILFTPKIAGIEMWGVHEGIYHAILKCNPEIRKDLCRNIVMSGGTSLFPGFGDRLLKELQMLFNDNYHVSIVELENRKYLPFKGASEIAASSNFSDMCISTEEYDEYGPMLVHSKCVN